MIIARNTKYVTFFTFFLISRLLFAQTGNYFIHNYSPREYKAAANNSGVTQNNEGLIFIANNNGVLIYDGVSWQQCKQKDEQSIFCIAKTNKDQIVAGTDNGDIAIIEKDTKGIFRYRSLLQKIAADKLSSQPIRQIFVLGAHTYFLSKNRLVDYDGQNLSFFSPEEEFHTRAFVMGNHFFIWDRNIGIKYMQNGKLKKIPNTESLSVLKFFFCYKQTRGKYALYCREEGVYQGLIDSLHPENSQFRKINSPLDKKLLGAEVNNGCLLRDGKFVITTNKDGAFLLNNQLNVLQRFNTDYGIFDNNVKGCFEDNNGNIWLSLYYGISFLEINSQVRKYDRSNGINGTAQSAAYYDNQLYVATDKDVQYFDSLLQKFVTLPEFNYQTWYLYKFGNSLLIATAKGLFEYNYKSIKQLSNLPSYYLTKDQLKPEILYCATGDGVEVYGQTKAGIEPIRSIRVNAKVGSIAATRYGIVAFSAFGKGIYLLANSGAYLMDSITTGQGLPDQNFENYVFTDQNQMMVATSSGILGVKLIKNKLSCSKETPLFKLTQGKEVFKAAATTKDLICSEKFVDAETNKLTQTIAYYNRDLGRNIFNHEISSRLKDVTPNAITIDEDRGITLICCNEALFMISNKLIQKQKRYNLFIKTLLAKEDTLAANISIVSDKVAEHVLPYSRNDIYLTLGFSSYENSVSEYSFKLEGRDKDYSKWLKDNEIQFANLSEGSYTIKVRARAEVTKEVFELVIKIKILPPWYRTLWAYLIYFLLLIVTLYFIVQFNVKRLKTQNKNLEEIITARTKIIVDQKGELEHKQKEIIDSINYAQRIQQALLASEELLNTNLTKHFVLFKPKDIVSGDFYWATLTDNGFLLITADCTGHGVPGAFMSLLNISKLNETIIQKRIQRPDLILNEVRDEIILALNPPGSKEESKDGMDAVLLKFDHKAMKLQYAAANNSFYIVRNKEIIVCKADKMPVGKGHDNTPYTFNEMDLMHGDVIYVFTDGFADQFGGPKGKKFKYKQMEELIVSIADREMKEQHAILENAFQDWKGPLEQVDDVCIIGVRI